MENNSTTTRNVPAVDKTMFDGVAIVQTINSKTDRRLRRTDVFPDLTSHVKDSSQFTQYRSNDKRTTGKVQEKGVTAMRASLSS